MAPDSDPIKKVTSAALLCRPKYNAIRYFFLHPKALNCDFLQAGVVYHFDGNWSAALPHMPAVVKGRGEIYPINKHVTFRRQTLEPGEGLDSAMKTNMRKGMILFLLLFLATGAAWADTIYLKNGREVSGTFTGFENGEFTITGTDGDLLRFRADRVVRVVIDRDARWRGDERRSQRGRWENFDPIEVQPESAWVQSPVQVSKGQKLRVEASGTVTLDNRIKANPEGLSGQRTRNLPMPNQNVGALIARIGTGANSSLLYIGRSAEIVADRGGILYFAVNYPRTANSLGAFVVNVSSERGSGSDLSGRSRQIQKTINVNANQAWTDTGIDLDPNMTVEIVADGQITYDSRSYVGPDGNRSLDRDGYPVRNVGVGAMIARIRYSDGRESSPIFIGTRNQATTRQNEYGRLFIGINDDNFSDNTGSYRVTIRNVSTDQNAGFWSGRSPRAVTGGEKAITVNANQPWTDTGIDLRPNMAVDIVAEGQIAYSSSANAEPDGGRNLGINLYPVRNAGVGAVIAKIRYQDGRESNPIFIGASNQVSTGQDEYGRLFIGVNDDNFNDNKGSYRVTIRWR